MRVLIVLPFTMSYCYGRTWCTGNRPREDNCKVVVIMRVRNIITRVVNTGGRIKVNDFVFYLLPFPLSPAVTRRYKVRMAAACVRRLFACKTIAFRSNTRCVFFSRSPFFYSPFAFLILFLHVYLSAIVDGCLPDGRPDQHDTCCCIILNDARQDLREAAADGTPPLRDICAAPGDNN